MDTKKTMITIAYIAFALLTHAQSYFPIVTPGNTFEVRTWWQDGTKTCDETQVTTTSQTDSLGTYYFIDGWPFQGWMREDTTTGKVWYSEGTPGTVPEALIYDMSLVLGDTFSYNVSGSTYSFTVSDVSSIPTPLGPRKKIIFSGMTPFFQILEWIEGIGNTAMLIYTPLLSDPDFKLNKVWNNSVLVYDENLICPPSSIPSLTRIGTKLWYHEEEIHLTSATDEPLEVMVYASNGQLIKSNVFMQTGISIPTNDWSTGVYIVVLKNEKGEIFSKRVAVY